MKDNYCGLTNEEVSSSREKHGNNSLEKEKRKSFYKRFFENLSDPIIKVLVVALAVEVVFTFGNCNLFEVFGILAAILISTTVSTISECGSEMAFEKMEEENLGARARVIRNCEAVEIKADEIVVGDIMLVSAGETVHADGIIISGELSVNQSALNGESAEVSKSAEKGSAGAGLASKSRVFRGSLVTMGAAVVRVERVGSATFYGGVAKDVQKETRESPLKRRLGGLAADISKIGYVMAALVGFTYLFNTYVVSSGFNLQFIISSLGNYKELFSNLLHTLTLMITVIVVAVPEGLPMMITVVLSANMKKMLADNILIKKLVGIETAGSMNILFTDKTGTITEGRLECEEIITQNGRYKSIKALRNDKIAYEPLVISAKYNTDCSTEGEKTVGGNATDRAIYSFFESENINAEIKHKEAFNSDKKCSSVTLKNGKFDISHQTCDLHDFSPNITFQKIDSDSIISDKTE